MGGGKSKDNPPNSDSSNQIHKQATEAQDLARSSKQSVAKTEQGAAQSVAKVEQGAAQSASKGKQDTVDTHQVNKALVAIGALAIVGLFIYSSS